MGDSSEKKTIIFRVVNFPEIFLKF